MSITTRRVGYPTSVRRLISELSKLPSIGEKSAARLAYHIVTTPNNYAEALSRALLEAAEKVRLCTVCFALAEDSVCEVCKDAARTDEVICVVEKPSDVIAVEKSGGFQGRYHVLHGLWSPMRGTGPETIRLADLFGRVKRSYQSDTATGGPVRELILATSATVEGDATALYIANEMASLGVAATRIAHGIPMGGELEYADELTLNHAFEGRRKL